jgi:hypothetical protein
VKFTGVAQSSQVDPAVWLKIPVRALELTQILGQPCEFQVVGRGYVSLLTIFDTWDSKTFRGVGHLLIHSGHSLRDVCTPQQEHRLGRAVAVLGVPGDRGQAEAAVVRGEQRAEGPPSVGVNVDVILTSPCVFCRSGESLMAYEGWYQNDFGVRG